MWIISTVATDSLVLKHQAVSSHNADYIIIVLGRFHTEILHLEGTILNKIENIITFKKKMTQKFEG